MRAKYAFVAWFPIFATTIVIAFLAVAGMPPQQSGPGALTALGLIPNLIILGLCLAVGVLCFMFRPRPLVRSRFVAVVTVSVYILAAIAAFASPTVTGYETTHIRVIDSMHQPVFGVRIRVSSQQPFSFVGALTPQTKAESITDSSGLASIRVNRAHTIHGSVNSQSQRPEYRFATFMRSPNPDGTFRLEHSWSSSNEKQANTNMHSHVSKTEPYSHTIIVFLPSVGGDDTSPYASR